MTLEALEVLVRAVMGEVFVPEHLIHPQGVVPLCEDSARTLRGWRCWLPCQLLTTGGWPHAKWEAIRTVGSGSLARPGIKLR